MDYTTKERTKLTEVINQQGMLINQLGMVNNQQAMRIQQQQTEIALLRQQLSLATAEPKKEEKPNTIKSAPEWLEMFSQYQSFYSEHGHSMITRKDHLKLYRWIHKQRCKGQKGELKYIKREELLKLVDPSFFNHIISKIR